MIAPRLVVAIALPALLAPGVIELRGGAEVEAPIESITLDGVRVGGSAPRIISWDRVKAITGEHANETLEYEEIADAAWRARTRLARGDAAMAEPLYAWLFHLYQSGDGPTAMVVARGYLQCLLDRGAQAEAVAPWLDTVRLGAGDADTVELQLSLPPIFDDSLATRALGEAGLPRLFQPTGGAAHALSWWYAEAARFDAGLAGQLPTTRPGEFDESEDDLAFIEHLVSSRTGGAVKRQRARVQLRSIIDHEPGSWREAWARVAIGRSLLLEDDLMSKSLGVIELLHVPARFANEQPALAALALRDAASALRLLGDDAGATVVLEQLPQIDPTRPAPEPRPPSTHVETTAYTNLNDSRSAQRP